MELSFVTAALRRRWWVVLVFLELGILPLLFGGSPVETALFESVAQLEVVAPDDARSSGGPDRYVLNQVEVLNSRSIYEEAAEKVNPTLLVETADRIAEATEVDQAAESDIVSITVRQKDAEAAQFVAQTIADTYIARLTDAEDDLRAPEIASFEQELIGLRQKLTEANEAIAKAMEPFIARVGEPGYSVPPVSSVAPQADSDKRFYETEIQRINQLKTAAQTEPSAINTKIVQAATLPTVAVAESSRLLEAAFLVGMTLLGLTAALLWGRFSSKVLDEVAAEEIMGVPVVATIKKSRSLKQDPHVALTRLPQELIATIDSISVQAEAMAQINQSLRVAVVGTQRGAGSTTVALAMAARFAAAEYSVVVVDADRRDPWITDVFGADRHGGIPALLGASQDGLDRIFTRTSEPDVRVLGLGQKGTALRREAMPSLVAAASTAADIIIFDGGPLMDAASTVELCNSVDAVVVCVPLADQRIDDLAAVARQFGNFRERVLPVISGPVRKAAHRSPASNDPGADASMLQQPFADPLAIPDPIEASGQSANAVPTEGAVSAASRTEGSSRRYRDGTAENPGGGSNSSSSSDVNRPKKSSARRTSSDVVND